MRKIHALGLIVSAALTAKAAFPQEAERLGITPEEFELYSRESGSSAFERRRAEYELGGSGAEAALKSAVSMRAPGSLELAREALLDQGGKGSLSRLSRARAVLNALGKYRSQEALNLLKEAMAGYDPPASRCWTTAQDAWAAMFYRRHGDDSFELGARRAHDRNLDPLERSLHVVALGNAGFPETAAYRDTAITACRPFLSAPEPELQCAAVLVSKHLWDFDSLPALKTLAFQGANSKARSRAFILVMQFLQHGPQPPSQRNQPAHDPDGLQEWMRGLAAWREMNNDLARAHAASSVSTTGSREPARPQPGAKATNGTVTRLP